MSFESAHTAASQNPVIRRLWPADSPALVAHFRALDAVGRHSRFGGAVSDAYVDGYAAKAPVSGTVIYGAFDRSVLCAVCELRPVGDGAAEAAFSVLREHRHHGLASQLMERAITAAGNRGIERLIMLCITGNEPMRQLARKFGAEIVETRGEIVGEIVPPGASPATFFEESFREAAGFVQSLLVLPLVYASGSASREPYAMSRQRVR